MAYLNPDQLQSLGLKSLGRNVLISERAAIHDAGRIEIGDHSRVDDFCVLSGTLRLGRNVHIAVLCNLAGGSEGIDIGDFAGVAYGSHIFSQTDDYLGAALTGPTVPVEFRRETKVRVCIGRHSIIGAGSIILPGVTLGEGTSLGARSVVTRDTLPWSIYVGAPARRLKARDQAMLALEQAYLDGEGR